MTNIINQEVITALGIVLGGIALFIYGIDQMSDGLKSMAGNHIREYIEKYTRNLFMAVTVGTIITALLNSSTAVTVISISLVRAGLMKLEQAIGITIGANIGTCVTSIMIGLNIEQFAYYFVFVGIALMFLGKKKTLVYLGKTLFGFGLLFAGLEIMSTQLVHIADQPWFTDLMMILGRYPWLALVGGTVATAILQSSAALIGIVQKLYTTGAIAPAAGAAFIFGANVGTCLTAIVAGAGGSVSTRRAAWFHAVYNIVGALIGMVILTPFIMFTDFVNSMIQGGPEMWIAQAHLIFNIGSTILIFPFVNQSVKLLKFFIPGEDKQGTRIETIDELDYSLIEQFPAAALEVAKKNTVRMGRNVIENVKLTQTYMTSREQEDFDEIMEVEAVINKYDTILSKYLAKIVQQQTLGQDQTVEYSKNFQIIKNIERISDICVNLANFYRMAFEEEEKFSDIERNELDSIYDKLLEMLKLTFEFYDNSDSDNDTLMKINELEKNINDLERTYRDNHFARICNKIDDHNQIIYSTYIDMLSNLERIGDHTLNIANGTITNQKNHDEKYLVLE
ncbi:Na/Pi cotransporter family protein [uncultured Thomasclavelia sp.]|uniref:Na/Pi cotransporter family protein n=1 Tax=uncultured Thomasclavelia sp. TaxID=3025759 RepID=UPI0025E0B091|nr:Na/Pi cotransporter family protein [uncultured Thomasclavelia sp.]